MHVSAYCNMTMYLRQQREIIYKQRKEVMETENYAGIIEAMIKSTIERAVAFSYARRNQRRLEH